MKFIKSNLSKFATNFKGRQTHLYQLRNKNGIEMAVSDFGARVIELWIPDKKNIFHDVVLGLRSINDYINTQGEQYLGAAIGRFANRIARGKFILNSIEYQLPLNEGPNSLHGGFEGFDRIVWEVVDLTESKITFSYTASDGEQGFPGTLDVKMTYQLTENNEFKITYQAVTDCLTVVNLTHHSFFNLHGEGNGTINDHWLWINADYYLPIDNLLIPTGQIAPVDDTPMDFRNKSQIGNRLESGFSQLAFGKGYDHNWVLKKTQNKGLQAAASVYDTHSGRCLEVFTTQPGVQFYGGNFFNGKQQGKSGKYHQYREAFALETQHFPDSPNQPSFPPATLDVGEIYEQECVYKFSIF